MRKFILLLLLLLASANSFAHFMWIETRPTGKLNQKQEVRVYFGEYNYGIYEEVAGEAFGKMKNFEVFVISPAGKKLRLEMQPDKLYYSGSFTPIENGTHTIILNNNSIDVIDYTQYNFGIFKTHYHSTAKVEVGTKITASASDNIQGLSIVDMTQKQHKEKGEAILKVLFKGQPVKDAEVSVFVADQWAKKLTTDENGLIKFSLPWNTKYVIEATSKEEVAGNYNGKDYQFIWHCATYNIPLQN